MQELKKKEMEDLEATLKELGVTVAEFRQAQEEAAAKKERKKKKEKKVEVNGTGPVGDPDVPAPAAAAASEKPEEDPQHDAEESVIILDPLEVW